MKKLTDKEVLAKGSDLEMMRRPHLWPHLILPLVIRDRLTRPGIGEGIGILWSPIGAGEGEKFLFLRGHNMLMPIPKDAKWEEGGDELLIRLIKEGWVID
jgi:hypothetical protein